MSNTQSFVLALSPQNLKNRSVQPHDVLVWDVGGVQPATGDWLYCFNSYADPQGIWSRWRVRQSGGQTPTGGISLEIEVESVRGNCRNGLLPLPLLYMALPDAPWLNPPPTFVLSNADGQTLEALWQEGVAQHSLLQYVRWSQADEVESRPDWLSHYQETTALAARIRQQPELLDEAALWQLWGEGRNGITGIGQGRIENEEFDRNLPLLRELTLKLAANPDHACFLALHQAWGEALAQGKVVKNRPAMLARLCAAFRPDVLTTSIKSGDCANLLNKLGRYFELHESVQGDWYQLNEAIQRCMQQAGLPVERMLENNIAVWQLNEAVGDMEQEKQEQVAMTSGTPDTTLIPQAGARMTSPLNQIFYGPPGTGKTYHCINAALEILDPAFLQANQSDRETLKKRFDALTQAGHICFVTFHQSFSYEDFVEGLRAETVNGQVQYRVADGVFKQVCTDAMHADLDQQDVFGQSIQILQSHFEQQDVLTLQTPRGKPFTVLSLSDTSFTAQPASSVDKGYTYPTPFESVRKIYHGRKDQVNSHHSYAEGMLNYLKAKCGLPDTPPPVSASQHRPRVVLIIDEINRGNISRIFGELITLIEPSKRAGAEEALSVTLPYSKDSFSVPDNVYIIGTMNTADRSLAGLDLALRRRFSFTEMPPRPDLLDGVMVEGVNIGQMLRVMNERITVLLDRDHTIGHAYFMPLQTAPTLAGLADIFRQKILPLLQEYFFEDWERIRWVLNDQTKPQDSAFIIEDKSLDVSSLFSGVADKLRQSPQWRLNDGAFTKPDAYLGIAANLGQRVPDQPVTDGANT